MIDISFIRSIYRSFGRFGVLRHVGIAPFQRWVRRLTYLMNDKSTK
nr:MAG TPA: hypothetical protein [Caudoviricetes sp.]